MLEPAKKRKQTPDFHIHYSSKAQAHEKRGGRQSRWRHSATIPI